MKTWVKVDVEAIAANGPMPKGLERTEYHPAIIVIQEDERGQRVERRVHTVKIQGPSIIVQDDKVPGCKSADGRLARIWIYTEAPVILDDKLDKSLH